jgi:serine/threonine-protein kinase
VALPLGTGNSPHWGLNDMIVYTDLGALFLVGSSGGEPELLLDSDTLRVAWPHLLPNGKAVVFSTFPSGDLLSARILIFEMETGEVRELVSSGNNPRYVPTGHLVYGHGDGALMGVPFDQETLRTTGTLVTLLPELALGVQGAAKFAVSETGTLIYQGDVLGGSGTRRLVEVDLEGTESPLPLSAGFLDSPRYSPDGSKIAYEDVSEIRVYDVVTGASPQFTSGGGAYPVWAPSGENLYASVTGNGFRRPTDAREEATLLYEGVGIVQAVSPSDSIVVVRANTNGRARDLLLMRQGASGAEFEDFLTAEWNEGNADISPDGQWIVYQSDQSGEPRIYVHSFPVITGRRDVSPGVGTDPVWDRDGRTLYYRSGPQFLAVDVTTEPAFAMLSAPEVLFDGPDYTRTQSGGWERNWDIHPDGSRFIMVSSGSQGGVGNEFSEVYLVTSWFEELKQRFGN